MVFNNKFLFLIWTCIDTLLSVAESNSDDIVIFYNIYIPNNNKPNPDHAIDIVKEQLEYKEKSIIANAPLHYVTIGKDIGELENCNNCKKIKHINGGSEIDTLSHVHEYCTTYPDSKVLYMHNKGSFHGHLSNELLRKMLNKAIFSTDCLLLKTPNTITNTTSSLRSSEPGCKCNICSARFSPNPYLYMSGNMWVSQCSYISKLIHPSKIESEMYEMAKSAPVEKFGNILQENPPHFLGIQRCSHEHWVATHPNR